MFKVLTKYSMIILTSLILSVNFSFSFDYIESFTNNNAPTNTYGNGSFTGDNGIVWNYQYGRYDANYQINGKDMMFRAKATGYDPRLYSDPIPGGIVDFKVTLRKGYTGSGLRSCALYINGEYIATSTPFDINNELQTFEVKDINIPGDIVIELRNLGPQLVIDDLSWTVYGKPGNGVPTRVRVVKLIPDNPIQGIPFKAVVQLVDDNDTPQKLTTNTLVDLKLKVGNGILNGAAPKVIAAGQTTALFENLVYTSDDLVTLQAQAPNNKLGPDAFLRDILLYVDFIKKPTVNLNLFEYGHVGVNHPTISAQAIGDNGEIITDYNGYTAYLKYYIDPATPINTTAKFDRGIATFSTVVFDQEGDWTIELTADSLGSIPSNLNVNVKPLPVMTEVIVPKYFKGYNRLIDFGERMPNYALVKFDNLHPNVKYRFVTGSAEAVPSTKPTMPGGMLAYNNELNSYFYTSNKNNLYETNSSQFIASENSSYIWINIVNNSNAEFNQGKDINWAVDLATDWGSPISRYYTVSKSRNVGFSPSCNTTDVLYASGIYDDHSTSTPKNYLVFYDQNNDPVSAALVQESGSEIITPGFPHQAPEFYARYEKQDGAFATFIPNNLAGGIRKIVEYDPQGNVVKTYTDNDGIWAGYQTDTCAYGVNPPLPEDEEIRFQLPHFDLIYPAEGSEICKSEAPIRFFFEARGLANINILLSTNGTEWETIQENYNARLGYYDWTPLRGKYSDRDLQFRFESKEFPIANYTSAIFRIYDQPVIISTTPSMNYCVNQDVSISVSSEGSLLTYQWYKDSKPIYDNDKISGTDEPVLRIKSMGYGDGGLYTVRISGHENCNTITSKPIGIFPATEAEYIEPAQDTTITVLEHELATLTFRIHINGVEYGHKDIERYGMRVQWYQKDIRGVTPVVDDNRISGAKSSYLTIKNFGDADARQYYAELEGLCNIEVKSPIFTLEKSNFTFVNTFSNILKCEGDSLTLDAKVKTNSSNDVVTFRWFKDNELIENNPLYSGETTSQLKIIRFSDEINGLYYVEATLNNNPKTTIKTNLFKITNLHYVEFTNSFPDTLMVTEGDEIKLEVQIAESLSEVRYSWHRDITPIESDGKAILIIDNAKSLDQGLYYCKANNLCGASYSDTVFVQIVPKQFTSINEISNNSYSMTLIEPNPVGSIAKFTINSNYNLNATIKLIDIQGNTVSTIHNGLIASGQFKSFVDTDRLNLSNGTYFLLVQSDKGNLIQKFVVFK